LSCYCEKARKGYASHCPIAAIRDQRTPLARDNTSCMVTLGMSLGTMTTATIETRSATLD
jgi:hypothetical protein